MSSRPEGAQSHEVAARDEEFPSLGEMITDPRAYAQQLGSGLQRQLHERPFITPLILIAAVVVGIVFAYVAYVGNTAPSADGLDREQFARASVVYTADGEELTRYYRENRTWVSLDEMAPVLKEATLATEDRRFYDHFGIDIHRTIGAVWSTLRGSEEGGSTLTMQLARNAFPQLQDDFVLTRKIREWSTALEIERKYEKDEILEMYLNMMPFSYNAFGVEAASQTYFQQSASEIDTLQAATLVAMFRGPTLYNPHRNPEIAYERRNLVLRNMVETGDLSEDRYEALRDEETELDFERITHTHNLAPFFAEHVRRQVQNWADDRGHDIYSDGLQIHTTLDSRLQELADAAAQQHAAEMQAVVDVSWSAANVPFVSSNPADYMRNHNPEAAFDYYWQQHPDALDAFIQQTERFETAVAERQDRDEVLHDLRQDQEFVDSLRTRVQRLETGLVAMDPGTGHVKAWVGGRNFEEDRFDRVSQSQRQPGSTFKPIVYAAALNRGYRPNDLMQDRPITYVDERTGQRWEPGNFGRISGNLMTLRDALAHSINTIAAQLTIDLGPQRIIDYARRMGIRSELPPYPSLGLGTGEVTLLEMATVYSTIANVGTHREPLTVTRIADRHGETIQTFDSPSNEAMSSHAAYDLVDILRSAVDEGTGVRLGSYLSGDLAGKTGTTQNNADGWFMMMHPELVVGGWIGFNNPALTFRTREWGQGSRNALPLVGRFAQQADLSASASFHQPPGWTPPPDVTAADTLSFADVQEELEELFEEDPEQLELDELMEDGVTDDIEELIVESEPDDTDAPEGPDLSEVEGQDAADSLTQSQRVDLPDIRGSDNNDDTDT